MPHKVEGVDYTPAGIMALHTQVAIYRNEALVQAEFSVAIVLSHVCALLYYLAEVETQRSNQSTSGAT